MPVLYETDPFRVLRAALSELAESALYLETESDCAPANPCPDYVAHLRDAVRTIGAAQSFDDLAAVEWIAGRAAIALDGGV